MVKETGCLCDRVGMSCISREQGLCARLQPESFRQLAASAHLEEFPAGRILWHDDDGPSVIGVILSGVMRFERCTLHGRRQVLNLVLPGELVGWEVKRGAGYTMETATPVTLCRFDTATFDRLLARDHALRQSIFRQNSNWLERLRWLTWAIGALTPEERLAAFLVSGTEFMPFQPDDSGGGILTVTLDRKDVADLHATTPESVCRILKGFERDGLILLETPRCIRINDLATLAEIGRVSRNGDRPSIPATARMPSVATNAQRRKSFRMTPVNAPHAPCHLA